MEETVATPVKPGIMTRIMNFFTHTQEVDAPQEVVHERPSVVEAQLLKDYRYTVTIRRQITAFDDAMAAANGLKRGDQQILNLSGTDDPTRQKIVDFMCGVNYAQEGTWEEIGENVYLIVPSNAYVEVAPPTPRMSAMRN
ncbi:MAG: cell division protein SepF [Fimbriimonas sp.]|nr:cell division protein SepF [Fimbriimonas sp.]